MTSIKLFEKTVMVGQTGMSAPPHVKVVCCAVSKVLKYLERFMIKSIIMEEARQEGREEARRETLQTTVLRVLEKRFKKALPKTIVETIRATSDLDQLNHWFDVALIVPDLATFRQALKKEK
jgi:hypothetical protein